MNIYQVKTEHGDAWVTAAESVLVVAQTLADQPNNWLLHGSEIASITKVGTTR